MSVLSAVALALLSAAALPVAPAAFAAVAALPPKPGAGGGDDSDREASRGRGIGVCVGEMRGAEGVTAEDLEAACGCALDRYMARHPSAALTAGPLPAAMGGDLLSCASSQRPAIVAAIARRLSAQPGLVPPPIIGSDDSKPSDTSGPAPADAPKRPGSDLRSWLDGLSLPAWLTDSGLPLWALVPLALLVFLFLRGLLRRGDERDLIGPPPSMRLGERHNQPEPRRADPPQRS